MSALPISGQVSDFSDGCSSSTGTVSWRGDNRRSRSACATKRAPPILTEGRMPSLNQRLTVRSETSRTSAILRARRCLAGLAAFSRRVDAVLQIDGWKPSPSLSPIGWQRRDTVGRAAELRRTPPSTTMRASALAREDPHADGELVCPLWGRRRRVQRLKWALPCPWRRRRVTPRLRRFRLRAPAAPSGEARSESSSCTAQSRSACCADQGVSAQTGAHTRRTEWAPVSCESCWPLDPALGPGSRVPSSASRWRGPRRSRAVG